LHVPFCSGAFHFVVQEPLLSGVTLAVCQQLDGLRGVFDKHGGRDTAVDQYSKFGLLLVVLIAQERGPWKLQHTVAPIACSLLVPVLSFGLGRRSPAFNWRSFLVGSMILALAIIFFARGLDEVNDYLRVNHALWHVCVGLSAYHLWASVPRHAALLFQSSRQEARKEDRKLSSLSLKLP
jgi:hypothetical protein